MRYLVLIFYILLFSCAAHGQEWRIFNSPSKTYIVELPSVAENIQGTSIYACKDTIGNLFCVQEFTPPEDLIKKQSSKEILRTAIKVLVLKKNVLLSETIYSKYMGAYVSVDFTGKITTLNRPLRGKLILEDKKLYYMYAILYDESMTSINNYKRFIHSFKLIN